MPANSATPSKSGNPGLILFGLLAVGLTLAAIWLLNDRKPDVDPAVSGDQVRSTLHLDTFVLNLADPGQRSYLRVGIDLGLGFEIPKSGETLPVPQVRDTILSVLGRVRVDDILTEDGKAKLKAELLRTLQERVPGLAVKEVYFTEFLIQR